MLDVQRSVEQAEAALRDLRPKVQQTPPVLSALQDVIEKSKDMRMTQHSKRLVGQLQRHEHVFDTLVARLGSIQRELGNS